MLSDQELLRYSRQVLLAQIDIDGQLRLKQSKALIVGLGGLGSPVALYLAAAGVGELHLADFDTVDLTNLQRQVIHDSASVGMSKVDSAPAPAGNQPGNQPGCPSPGSGRGLAGGRCGSGRPGAGLL